MKYQIGVDVGGTKIAYGIFNEQYELIAEVIKPSMPEAQPIEMIDTMTTEIDNLIQKMAINKDDIHGVGAVFPGHIDYSKGLIITCANLPNWSNVFVRKELEERLNLPVFVDNDANIGALAEARLGVGRGKKNLIYVTISTGIGAGIYLNGQMVRGTYGSAGELGHIFQDVASGARCGCGQIGCVESVASGTGMTRYVKARIAEGEKTTIVDIAGNLDAVSPFYIAQAARQGDTLAIETLDYVSTQLGYFFASLYQIFNTDIVVYGGGVTKIGPLLMDAVREKFLKLVPIAKKYPMELVETSFPDSLGMIGAALLVE